jgi:hypothetical protein
MLSGRGQFLKALEHLKDLLFVFHEGLESITDFSKVGKVLKTQPTGGGWLRATPLPPSLLERRTYRLTARPEKYLCIVFIRCSQSKHLPRKKKTDTLPCESYWSAHNTQLSEREVARTILNPGIA